MADEPTKKSKNVGCLSAMLIVGSLFAGMWWMFSDASPPATSTRADKRAQAVAQEQRNAMPFLGELAQLCETYDAAPNEIKKSAVFRDAMQVLKSSRVADGRGVLTAIRTTEGGGELMISIDVAGGATFKVESLFAPIKRGTKVYEQVEEMREGQCVVFSADRLEAASLTERSKVCDPDFFARFSSVARCK